MPRTILAALAVSAALLLVAPATGTSSSAKISGRVAAFSANSGLIRVDSRRLAHILQLPTSHARIRVGQRVDLRGTTLRRHGHGSRVLARNVQVVRSISLGAAAPGTGGSLAPTNDDELEVKGTLAALSPVTVTTSSGSAVCVAPAGMSLSGFAVGDFVEMTCDLRAGVWTVRKLQHEDDDVARGDDDDDDDDDRNSGPANCDRSGDEGHSGPGSCEDADDDHGNSGHGNSGDDDDHNDDNSGSGHGHDGDDD